MGKNFLTPIVERFWKKVELIPFAECWYWTGGRSTHGYGMIGVGRRGEGVKSAHTLSYEIHFGPIPKGKIILHKCNNYGCVRPDHLSAGSYSDNILQAYRDGLRKPRGKEK